jgi:O-antigen/teichoic acid export membrane protein
LNQVALTNIGEYNLAYSFSNYFGSFNNSMNSILSPIYFKCFAMKDQKKSIRFTNSLTILWFIFILICCLLICVWCKEIFSLLYRNPDFSDIYRYVPFLLIGMMYRPFYVVCVDKNIYFEKTKNILLISLGGGVINLILNLIFIPIYGLQAALYTTFFSYLYMGFSGFYIKSLRKNIDFSYNPVIFIATIVLTLLFGVLVRDVDLLLKILITILLILTIIILYKFKLSSFIKYLNKENLI